jgi:hypothetical protein
MSDGMGNDAKNVLVKNGLFFRSYFQGENLKIDHCR